MTGVLSWSLFVMTVYLWNFPPISSWLHSPFLPLNPSPLVALRLPLDGPSLHAVVAAVGLRLDRTAQTATGKHWIESWKEEAQTDTHHKAAECPAWPRPHPLMRSLVEESEATGLNKSSAQPVLHSPEPAFLGHHKCLHVLALDGGWGQKSHQRGTGWGKVPETSGWGPFFSNSSYGPVPQAGRSWIHKCF